MFKRIKNLWRTPKAEVPLFAAYDDLDITNQKAVHDLILNEAAKKYQILKKEEKTYVANAEFLGEGTHEEYIEQERADKGLSSWYKRIGL